MAQLSGGAVAKNLRSKRGAAELIIYSDSALAAGKWVPDSNLLAEQQR